MKIISLILSLLLFLSTSASAFLYEVKILTDAEINKLTDKELVDNFIAAKIEVDASKTFHGKAGFTPKEYDKYKLLLGFVIQLRQEMQERGIEAPPVDEWLN